MFWNILVNRFSQFFHVQVEHIEVSIALRDFRFIVLFFNDSFVFVLRCLACLALNSLPLEVEVEYFLIHLSKAFCLRIFVPHWEIESFNLSKADMGLLEFFLLNSNGTEVLMFISENRGFGVCVQVVVMRRIFTYIRWHCLI
jgi:hypothetical protein